MKSPDAPVTYCEFPAGQRGRVPKVHRGVPAVSGYNRRDNPALEAPMDDRTKPTRTARYEEDLYSWAVEQAALLRAGKVTEADALNIAEELDDVRSKHYDKLEGALRLILRQSAEMGSPACWPFARLVRNDRSSVQPGAQSAAQESRFEVSRG
jgi:hypothetical protein